jgi:hypothetical protein
MADGLEDRPRPDHLDRGVDAGIGLVHVGGAEHEDVEQVADVVTVQVGEQDPPVSDSAAGRRRRTGWRPESGVNQVHVRTHDQRGGDPASFGEEGTPGGAEEDQLRPGPNTHAVEVRSSSACSRSQVASKTELVRSM